MRTIATAAAKRVPAPARRPAPAATVSTLPAVEAVPIFRCACGGTCPRCRERPDALVTNPGDAHEREADEVARRALAKDSPAPAALSATPRRLAPGAKGRLPAAVAHVVAAPGEALDATVRADLEPRFGADFSGVRIHRDAAASESARALAASAYTVGHHVAFAAGRYAPSSPMGRELLAHELAHVVQHSRLGPSVIARQGQEPLIPMPIFDELDICATVEGRTLCGSDLKKACEKLPSLPGCSVFKPKKKKEKKKVTCPPGFRPGATKDFEGTCCRGVIENDRDCCPPERIPIRATFPGCCPSGTHPDPQGKSCVKPPACPPEQQTMSGRCCEPPKVPQGFACVEPPKPQPEPPTPQPPTVTRLPSTAIEFAKDAPQPWFAPAAAYGASVTAAGKKRFDALVKLLQERPELKVQLSANASIEKPARDPDYNLRLTRRRAQLILSELGRRGIDTNTRVADPPGESPPTGCEELQAGVHACGDTGADPAPQAEDRNVTARAFTVSSP